MRLTLEGYGNRERVSLGEVARAIDQMASPHGPTYIIVEADDRCSYAQAAGTDGRYVVEGRDVFGEGFRHFRLYRGDVAASEPSVVYYRQKCSKHPPRGCPLKVLAVDVVGLDAVKTAILHYVQTFERSPGLHWRDITHEFLEESLEKDCTEIATIYPGAPRRAPPRPAPRNRWPRNPDPERRR
jgi:hypothetical protein